MAQFFIIIFLIYSYISLLCFITVIKAHFKTMGVFKKLEDQNWNDAQVVIALKWDLLYDLLK